MNSFMSWEWGVWTAYGMKGKEMKKSLGMWNGIVMASIKSRFWDNWRRKSKNMCREPKCDENKAEEIRRIFFAIINFDWHCLISTCFVRQNYFGRQSWI